MNNNNVSLVAAAILVSSLFGMACVGMSSHYALAQGATAGATVSMAKGSQSADNPEFYVPVEQYL